MRSLSSRFPLLVAAAKIALLASIVCAQDGTADARRAAIDASNSLMMQALEAGNIAKARAFCEQTISFDPENYVHRYNLACIESRAGAANVPRAIAALEQAVKLGLADPAMLKSDPDLAAARGDPKFAEIVRAVERRALATPSSNATEVKSIPAPRAGATKRDATLPPAATALVPERPVSLPLLAPKSSHLIGRAVSEDGRPLPEFTVAYHGFEDGKLANTGAGGRLIETVNDKITAKNGRYEIKLPAGAYRATGYVTYRFRDRTYRFELAPLNEPGTHDYPGTRLDKLGKGLVRDFVLRMAGKRTGAPEDSESGYNRAYYGGRVEFDANQYTGILGGGNRLSPALGELHPPASRVEITFEPQGPRVDGSAGTRVVTNLILGDSSKWTFAQRGIFPGVYVATARVITPDGRSIPLSVSLTPSRTILNGAGNYDQVVMEWQKSVIVDFLPNDLKPEPMFGVNRIKVYLGP